MDLNQPVEWKESKTFVRINWEPGLYPIVLKEVQPGKRGQHGDLIRLIFSVTHPKHGIAELPMTFYPGVSSRSRSGQVAKALGVVEGKSFTWPSLVGKHGMGLIETQTWTNRKTGSQEVGSVITKVLPIQSMQVNP